MIIADQVWTGIKTAWNGVTGFFDGMMDGWGGFADFAWPWLPVVGVGVGGLLAAGGVIGGTSVLGAMALGGVAGAVAIPVLGAGIGIINGIWRGGSDAVATVLGSDEEPEPEAAQEQEQEQEVAAQQTPDARRDRDRSQAVGAG